jgi:hypothetical protein
MDNEKHVDESWKDAVASDKCGADGCGCAETDCSKEECGGGCGCGSGDENAEMKVSFLNYVMSMGYQAMIFLGDIPNPMTNKQEANLRQAKFLIDTLQMLKDKTKGNLLPQEDQMLSSSLYELQMRYVELSKKIV